MDDDIRRGMEIRRAVVGNEYVDNAARRDDFNRPFQEIICRSIWGNIWGRGGLALRDRSLIVVAFLIAQGRTRELELHLRGAIRNGCTLEELREVIIQSIAYCGAPAAVQAMKAANSVLKEEINSLSEC